MKPAVNVAVDVAAPIGRAFSNIPREARKSLVYQGVWETADLLKNLAGGKEPTRDRERALC
jgi:hypothetical protein